MDKRIESTVVGELFDPARTPINEAEKLGASKELRGLFDRMRGGMVALVNEVLSAVIRR